MTELHRPGILIIDDTLANIQALEEILGSEYDIFSARNQEEGIARAEEFKPDLVLINIMMPSMDGFKICEIFKDNPATRSIPIIFITAVNMEEDEARALEMGAVDYITKPIRPAVIRARIKNHIELKRNRDYLEEISMIDGLTGIPNRRRLDEYLAQEWKRSQRQKHPISLLMLDIDHFKLYNDNYGHSAGDECLKKIARSIQDTLTRPADLAARYGGEEFACVLPQTGQDGARTIADRMHENLARLAIPHEYSPIGSSVTISIGISTAIPDQMTSLDDFIKTADRMLYRAKESGRNNTRSELI